MKTVWSLSVIDFVVLGVNAAALTSLVEGSEWPVAPL